MIPTQSGRRVVSSLAAFPIVLLMASVPMAWAFLIDPWTRELELSRGGYDHHGIVSNALRVIYTGFASAMIARVLFGVVAVAQRVVDKRSPGRWVRAMDRVPGWVASVLMYWAMVGVAFVFMIVGVANVALDYHEATPVTCRYLRHVTRSKGPSCEEVLTSDGDEICLEGIGLQLAIGETTILYRNRGAFLMPYWSGLPRR